MSIVCRAVQLCNYLRIASYASSKAVTPWQMVVGVGIEDLFFISQQVHRFVFPHGGPTVIEPTTCIQESLSTVDVQELRQFALLGVVAWILAAIVEGCLRIATTAKELLEFLSIHR